jgi:gliding motility-associated-like protein
MISRILFISIMIASSLGVYAQRAETIIKSERTEASPELRDCNSDAGSISLGEFVGQSSRNTLGDTIFLCWLDRFEIEHNGDFDLSGDPDPTTAPGIGYAWYDGVPTVTGPDLQSIEGDPQAYKPSGEMVVYVDELLGNATFENAYYTQFETFNEYISGGNITQKYFAPITFDQRFGSQALYEGAPAGECVNVRVDEAFPVVYLNPIEAKNIQTQFNGDADRVQFTIEGGMPEFDNSNYTEVIVQLKSKPSVKASLVGNAYTHGDQVEFVVPEFGLYQIIMRDDISCEMVQEVNVQENTIPVFVLDTISGQVGDEVCVTWSVRDFDCIEFIFGGLKFDPTVVQFSSFSALNFHDVIVGSIIGPDQISVQWSPLNDTYSTLPDGEEIVEICFDIIGEPGDCSPIYFNNTDAVFGSECGGGDVAPNQETGLICVDPPIGFWVELDKCGSRSSVDEGTATFQIFGGTAPFSYEFSGSGGTPLIESANNIPADAGRITIFDIPVGFNYELLVSDALGNDTLIDVDILTYDELIGINFVNVTDPTCYGDSDGCVGIEVSGGTIINPSDYSVAWSTNDYAVNELCQLSSGTYCVTVTEDFTGCEVSDCVNIGVEPLNLELAVLDTAACAESSTGRVEAIVSGGTPESTGYNFEWSSGADFLAEQGFNSVFPDLAPGMVYVEVWDSFRYCKVVDSIEMTYLYDLQVELQTQNPLCFGDSTGQVELLATLGNFSNPNFNFFPLPSPAFPPTADFEYVGNDSLYISGLHEGFYRIQVTETNSGCSSLQEIFLQQPTQVQSNIFTEDLGCQEDQLGSATIQVFGGNFPYELTSVSGLPDATIDFTSGQHTYNDLDSGTYYVLITDNNGCMLNDTFRINGTDAQLRIDSLVYEPFECVPGATTSITAYATSSGTTIFYEWWDNPDRIGIPLDPSNSTLENVGPGIYYAWVTDNNSCGVLDSVELFEPEFFELDIVVTEPECAGANGGMPGSICVNPVGGTPGFSYEWADGTPPDQPCLENIGEGMYSLQVSDFNNCRVDTLIEVNGPSEIDVNILSLDGISCNDGQSFDGEITVSATGGNNPTDIYSYELSTGTGGFGQVHMANDLEGGDNWVLVSFNTLSGSVCYADTVYFEIEVPEKLEIDADKVFLQDVSCFGDCDGIAIVGAQGGNDNFYAYNWLETGDNGAAVSGLCAGTYQIQITDANGCTTLDSITLNQPDELIVYIDPDHTNDINCFGPNTGQIQIIHQGGNLGGPFTYDWTNTDATGPLASDLAEGDYSVTVTDEKGCNASVDITLDAQEPVNASVPDPDPIPCFGEQTCITVDAATGGSGDYTFSINSGPKFSLDSCISVYANTQPYLIEVFDKDGCSYSTNLLVEQPDPVEVFLGEDFEVGLGEMAVLNPDIVSDNPVQIIEWSPMGSDDICLGSNCEQLEIHPSQNTTYQVIVTDSNGCQGEDEIDVRINSRRNVFVPNAFSPNGDAYNERFKIITGQGVSRVNYIRIYDRWGELVHNEENLEPNPTGVGEWDGTFRGSKLAPGVFVYLAEVEFIDGRVIVYRGSVTLLR